MNSISHIWRELEIVCCTYHHYIISDFLSYFQIGQLCDDDKSNPSTFHNAGVKNHHNNLCDTKSVWEVGIHSP